MHYAINIGGDEMAAKTTLAHRELNRGIPHDPCARDEMSAAEFNTIIAHGLTQAKAGESRPAEIVLHDLRKEVSTWK